jgi:hypothetical protein
MPQHLLRNQQVSARRNHLNSRRNVSQKHRLHDLPTGRIPHEGPPFKAHENQRRNVPPSQALDVALTRSQHAPGIMVGNDVYPEFHAEQYPPGTAPKEHTFYPQGPGENVAYSAGDTLGGSSSADVHRGMGHPGSGQTSGGQRKREGAGLEGVGASASDPMKDQGLDRDHRQGPKRGGLGSATEQEPSRAG